MLGDAIGDYVTGDAPPATSKLELEVLFKKGDLVDVSSTTISKGQVGKLAFKKEQLIGMKIGISFKTRVNKM
ncbi:hypothetical protein L1987_48613 [Smallanthus sonchifolius]|uniref:Uncharacterized protein n=1 Tax=Smallanthus sonchifolius TaxID=185202 RepID=A0ACB9FTB0_9ASTR|nr:hypothetical protein L1987_48613 [Smallanthus sonchifolius]